MIDPTGTKKVILSIDGEGMCQAILIAMLAELEKQSEKKCQDKFNMVAGISTGTIIAVGLALGMSAKQLLDDVYLKRLQNTFQAAPPGVLAKLAGSVVSSLLKVDEDLASRLISDSLYYAHSLRPVYGFSSVTQQR